VSLKTWKEEFYPVEAHAGLKEHAAKDSLRKWEGLRPENMARHGVALAADQLSDADGDVMLIDGGSCALCHHYAKFGSPTCGDCLLYKVRGKVACDASRHDENGGPYNLLPNPEPMIYWLKKAAELEANTP
jgi:hypothetical protein